MSQLSILNLGLGHISQAPIENLSEDSTQNDVATRIWVPCLQECLRVSDPNFAKVIEALVAASVSYTPPTGWSYAYVIPTNSLAIRRISNLYTNPYNKKGDDFRIIYVPSLSARVILTNTLDAVAEYTYYVTDTTLFDPDFVNMLSYRLAAEFAMPLNADPELAKEASITYNTLKSDAQRQASYENNVNNGESQTSIVDSRMSGLPTPGPSIGGMTFDQFNNGG